MIELKTSENGTLNIELNGDLTLQNITEIKTKIEAELANSKSVVIEHQQAEAFDVSYLQVLHALYNYTSMNNQVLSFNGNHPVEFISLLKNAGDYTLLKKLDLHN